MPNKMTDNEKDKALEYIDELRETINRQKAEIERLNKQIVFEVESAYDRGVIAGAKEFAEGLKEDISNHRLEMYMNGLKGTPRTQEITYECVEEYIDNLLKERVGENDVDT